jgi:transcriptional antiterminator NusG
MVDETLTSNPDLVIEHPSQPASHQEGPADAPPAQASAPSAAEAPVQAGPEQPPEKAKPAAGKKAPAAPPTAGEAAPAPEPAAGQPAAPDNKKWYVVKVQSGREESIKEAVERRVKVEGLEEFFDQILIPKEKETVIRNNKRVVREKKLFPGYLMARVEFNDRVLYLFRETSGVGDFVGAGLNHPPQPMKDHEVEKMLHKMGQEVPGEVKHARPRFERGDRVKVKDGVFAGMEGEVRDILEAKGLVRVELTVLGRPVPVELEYWQVEAV